VPVVAVFLSGRPLWVNREINAANAFVAAWLPGSEGGGVADVLLRTPDGHIANDFHGKLSFAWPRTAVHGQSAPQFALGYGLTYADHAALPKLPEVSGITGQQIPTGIYLDRGKAVHGYAVTLTGADGATASADVSPAKTSDGSLDMSAIDFKAQEDARRFVWNNGKAQLAVQAKSAIDLDRETNGDVMLVTTLRVDALPAQDAWIGMRCGVGCQGHVAIGPQLAKLPPKQWVRIGVSLKCFRAAGAKMHHVDQPFVMGAGKGTELAIARTALGMDVDQVIDCAK
jgi:beta-glucosidase